MTVSRPHGLVLAIDTASAHPGVALLESGNLLSDRYQECGPARGEVTAGFINSIFEQSGISAADLSVVGVVTGPGSYTGLRIALGLARGLCFASDTTVVGVSALELVVEASTVRSGPVCALLHAGRKKFYASTYDRIDGRWVASSEPVAMTPRDLLGDLARRGPNWKLVGDGADEVAAEATDVLRAGLEVAVTGAKRAATLALLAERGAAAGEGKSARDVMPVYVGGSQAVANKDRVMVGPR